MNGLGILAYLVAQRRREIGLRMALGTSAGVVIALGRVGFLGRVLFQVSPYDPGVLLVAVSVLAAIAALASYILARRARSRSHGRVEEPVRRSQCLEYSTT